MSDVIWACETFRSLTDAQQQAIGMLLEGMRDREVADALGVHRVTVSRWRLYHPAFRAALSEKRQQLSEETFERIAALLPAAVEALERRLADEKRSLSAVTTILKVAGLGKGGPPAAPLHPDDAIRQQIDERAWEIDREVRRYQSESERRLELTHFGMRHERLVRQREQAEQEVVERLNRLATDGPEEAGH